MPPIRPVRRGQLISPWGIGAMIDFPGDVSLMTCGLDAWPMALEECPSDIKVTEERLQGRLDVDHFRLPPEFRDSGAGVQHPKLKIPFVRFPQWHYCPRCGSMEKLSIFGERQRCRGLNYSEGRSCHSIVHAKRHWLIPVRFVTVCGQGHIEDFPFMEWIHRNEPFDETHKLRTRAGRSSSTLSGIRIDCSCGKTRSMAGGFNRGALNEVKHCSGFRPWLGEVEVGNMPCGGQLQAVQRGASNVYFPDIVSSIYLPQWESSLERKYVEILAKNWTYLTAGIVDGALDADRFKYVGDYFKVDHKKLLEAAIKRLEGSSSDRVSVEGSEEVYRKSEFDTIVSGMGGDNQDFFVIKKDINLYGSALHRFFNSICLIHKLRETRALVGFSRWLPEDGRSTLAKKADLFINNRINWLPAIVVRGEGIFFEFNSHVMEQWALREDVRQRSEVLINNYNRVRLDRGQSERILNPRFLLMHTFAHILINQLSFECGYGSSAIRERIYCNTSDTRHPVNGVLIYTASGDSEGSLGGLVRQGNPSNLENIIASSIHRAKWCSSDPVCMESRGQGPDSCNLAACHSCALLPETSCEEGNRILDRALIIGTLTHPEIGYFTDYD